MNPSHFDVQGLLFQSLGSIAPALFNKKHKYRRFTKKAGLLVMPCREQLTKRYASDNGRSPLEPVR